MLALAPRPALGGEDATTWRAGDLVHYRGGCHVAENMTKVAESGNPDELMFLFAQQEKCFVLPRAISAVLKAWVAGPYTAPNGFVGSVWEVLDQLGDTEFVWIRDLGGPHVARMEMSV